MKNKKITILLMLVILSFIFVGVFCFTYFSKFEIKNIKDEYTYSDLIKNNFELTVPMFSDKNQTIWNINGYDVNKGDSLKLFVFKIGENKLKITNNDNVKEYTFKVNKDDDFYGVVVDEKLSIPDELADYDGDGISNQKEKELGLATYTNDTDGDGLFDNVELAMGLDPTKKDKYEEVRSYIVNEGNLDNSKVFLNVSGKGNIANTFLDKAELYLSGIDGFVSSDVVTVSTSNKDKMASMEIHFKSNYSIDNYAIYDFDEENGSFKQLETFKDENSLYANIDFNSLFDKFFVGFKNNAPSNEIKNQIMFLIDNSGSMFDVSYVENKNNVTISENDYKDYGNDIDFNRLSLMNSLVERLGVDKYLYSVNAFTNSYCSILNNSKNKDEITKSINSLRTDCQTFNGTDVSGAIRKYKNSFDLQSLGAKYMIVLTDGIDSGWFNYSLSDYELKNIATSGIKIITIGLGKGVNSDYLQKIASSTNGKYLYATDSSMLNTLVKLIEQDIEKRKTSEFGDKEMNLIADSGFDVKKDGFSFENFGSKDSEGGNCYGFSYLTKLIYLNKLPASSKEEVSPISKWLFEDEAKMLEYTLTEKNVKRLSKGNVYSTKLNSEYTYFMNMGDLPSDYRYFNSTDGIAYLNSKYKDRMLTLGFEPYVKVLDSETDFTIDGEIKKVSKYETKGLLNLYDSNTVSEDNYDDYQVLQLINRYFRVQKNHIINILGDTILENRSGKYNPESEFISLKNELASGSPALISLNSNYGGHSVLATRMYRTLDLEEYVVSIYDSNEPGKDMPARFTRIADYEKNSGKTKYSFTYEYENSSIVFTSFNYAGNI